MKSNNSSPLVLFLATGLMLFALFFGAGNLIFPALMGQQAGQNVSSAVLGFVITGAGLPLLGVAVIGFSKVRDVRVLASRFHPVYGVLFASALYLSIGPLFATPRTATVAYEMGVKPILINVGIGHEAEHSAAYLLIFSIVFFAIACWFSLSPSKLIDRIGKILTPVLLICIIALVVTTLVSPMGSLQEATKSYSATPWVTGFLEGYNTMDGLAALVFAIIVIGALREAGLKETSSLMRFTMGAGVIAAVILGLVYAAVAYMGANSVAELGMLDNGADVLAKITYYYWGTYGNVLLFVIILLACLSTAIGLITANAEFFHRLLPQMSYRNYVFLFTLISCAFANYGLSGIISLSIPVLMLLYPLSIVLIILAFFNKVFGGRRAVYVCSLSLTLVVGLLDAYKAALAENPDAFAASIDQWLPWYGIGLGWIVPAAVGFVLGLALSTIFPQRIQA
ncbi:branched-chain amino acid transport system II carrier protein [Brackiella oedipodis]|uniref:branched-chain amino acid transport system II carrier protein n=1 Tax=Brackiella oedipodis TaxID=124225 RepID=UPI0006858778|nr:branched-chain amino acid transport system II carrier protein [Brackiella oedipodis]